MLNMYLTPDLDSRNVAIPALVGRRSIGDTHKIILELSKAMYSTNHLIDTRSTEGVILGKKELCNLLKNEARKNSKFNSKDFAQKQLEWCNARRKLGA